MEMIEIEAFVTIAQAGSFTRAAEALVDWLAADPTGSGDSNLLLIGDLNAYAQEDPVSALKQAGYGNLVEPFLGDQAYGYVFDGQWGYLDHALGSETIVWDVLQDTARRHPIVRPRSRPVWTFAPLPGTGAWFETSPRARGRLDEAAGVRLKDGGLTEDGFLKLHLEF